MISSEQENPIKNEPESASGLTEKDLKRIKLAIVIGIAMFFILLLVVMILVATASTKPLPSPPPKPGKRNTSYNPFVWIDNTVETPKKRTVMLFNNRTKLDEPNKTTPKAPPIILNTTENFEPLYLRVIFEQLDEHLLNVIYEDPQSERWRVPVYGREDDPYSDVSDAITPIQMDPVLHKPNNKFEWSFNGKGNESLFSTENCRLQFFDKYIELEAKIQTDYIFGMGERVDSFHLKNDNYSLWNRYVSYDLGADSETGMFGSHPFFLNRLKNKKDFIGVFMRNSNAMLFSFWHTGNGTFINYKIVGGIIDLYIFHAADPDYIIKKYHSIIGRPYLPPVWGMGFQQARKGYDVNTMKTVIETYQKELIPIDAIWADTELNEDYKTFTVNQKNFPEIKEFVKWLHDSSKGIDMKFVAITNPGLKAEPGYKYYDEALKENCLIMSAYHYGKHFEGTTLAGATVWLDYFQHSSVLVWAKGLHDLHTLAEFDGVWISENEPRNMCTGECSTSKNSIPNPYHNATEFDYIQFRPTLEHLERDTLPMAAYECCNQKFSKQFNTHNLFGLQSAKASHEGLSAIFEDKRFLSVSRSTWPGSGKYSSHWLAENFATWDSMIGSIAGMLNFNMFGIPHVGAPIGGFSGSPTPELLARWYELGCFSPLMLSYSNSVSSNKEAYAVPEIKGFIKKAMLERYCLLHWMYTQMFESFLWGGSVIHPLFFDFPEDDELYKREIVDRTFMWGKSLYIIPALIPGQTRTKAYLPNWRWYDLRTREMVIDHHEIGLGEYFIFDQPLGEITVLIKAGSIIPYQRGARDAKVMNVEDLKKVPALLIIAPDHFDRAQGSLIVDSEGIKPYPDSDSNTYRHYSFTYMSQIFRINKLAGFDFHQYKEIDYFWELIILDIFGRHQINYVCMMDTNLNKKELRFTHTMGTNTLSIFDENFAKMPMYNLETIVWGTAEQHDFCKFQVHLQSASYVDEGKTLIGEIVTTDPSLYQLKFDLKASFLTDKIVSMQIAMNEREGKQWVVPNVVEEEIRKTFRSSGGIRQSGFRTSPIGTPFAFEMSDPTDHRDFIFTSRHMPFVFLRNFIHLKFMVNSRHIFGLGERVGKFELDDGLYSIWNYDNMVEENGLPPGHNLYGSHPFYLIHLHNPKLFAGVFFLNSNPIDVKIRHVGMQTQIDHIFSGGIIDGFFFQKGQVEEVVKSYHYLIGNPVALPYWAFGYHQSRWGYRDIEHLKDVVHKFEINMIPLDAVWMDKDYMQNMRVFTINEKKWFGLAQFVKDLHDKGKHFVVITDPGIAIDPSYPIYKKGLERDLYIKGIEPGHPLKGVTWPGYSVWIDFLHPSSTNFWQQCLQEFYEKIPFDGLWLDMNEPSNFCDGECPDETHYNYYNFPLDYYDDLYYNPTHVALEDSTISMEAGHYGSDLNANEFNLHNLYGLMQTRATAQFFTSHLHKRPFVISSSTFPSIGRYASHWLGDNVASWHHLEYSIAGIFNFQLFGIPFVGADICGYEGNTTINLCSRWMQLGAFYPFMRNHNSPEHSPQEPYIDPNLMKVSIKAIRTRYSLARYIYSEYMHTAHRGGIIFKPLLFEFPDDKFIYTILDTTLMFGNAIRFTPVLEDGVSTLTSYFPNTDWFELHTFKKVMSYNRTSQFGQNLTLICPLESGNLNVHIKAGTIFAYQPESANDETITTITKLLNYPIQLIIVPDHEGIARGNIYYDDDHPKNYLTDHHDFNITLNHSSVSITLASGKMDYAYPYEDERINQVIILNAGRYRETKCAKCYDKKENRYVTLEYSYDMAQEILRLNPKEYKMVFSNINSIMWLNDTTC